ncbi:ProQ/FinO family protein [Comamonas sp. NLF-1-9]|uniref:ProQ/FinO family protein n=1 Tax=Comamonas sp. NLF-1-9 TaxID=2853163 RepID=UPI001C4421FF|nr:ProQ/FinO family protein [Comamonas sp. NLF-1-9]QXL83785.1 ProQ/FinO family protein [Comamonas sp. NLF-1-9]
MTDETATDTAPATPAAGADPSAAPPAARSARRPARTPPALMAQLAQWHPRLFGERPLPLKRGIFQDLMAAHAPDKDELKQALAWHTRSSRYLVAMASGQPRHDLQGKAVEPVAPEHLYQALIEVFRRRQRRSQEDLAPQLRQRIVRAYEASGLTREAYAERVRGPRADADDALDAALAQAGEHDARAEALLRAFEAAGSDLPGFAADYGLALPLVQRQLARARQLRALSQPA